jgi:hypothetical protein
MDSWPFIGVHDTSTGGTFPTSLGQVGLHAGPKTAISVASQKELKSTLRRANRMILSAIAYENEKLQKNPALETLILCIAIIALSNL